MNLLFIVLAALFGLTPLGLLGLTRLVVVKVEHTGDFCLLDILEILPNYNIYSNKTHLHVVIHKP